MPTPFQSSSANEPRIGECAAKQPLSGTSVVTLVRVVKLAPTNSFTPTQKAS